jgi:HlyD family secretion protein
MRTITGAMILMASIAAAQQEPVVQRSAIWIETVKRGDLPVMVRALGTLVTSTTAELRVPESQAKEVAAGQAVAIDTKTGVFRGKVVRVNSEVVNGTIGVVVEVAAAQARPGSQVDGTIEIARLNDVVYVGRPVTGQANGESTLFKLDQDGQHATRVKVQYGRSSVNQIEIRSGLRPDDRVILSNMASYDKQERVRLQ